MGVREEREGVCERESRGTTRLFPLYLTSTVWGGQFLPLRNVTNI
jgi:hypothetical protein